MTTIDTPLAAAPAGFGPVAETDRIAAMDVARGLALLGILFVNIQHFAEPFGAAMTPLPPEGAGAADLAAFYLVKVFCEGKFYPFFSLLFGMGLVLQLQRAERGGRPFVPLYVRRLVVLGLIGLCHALLLWYGDILFIYSLVGFALLLLARASARTLATLAIVILGVSCLLFAGFGAIGNPNATRPSGDPAGVAEVAPVPPASHASPAPAVPGEPTADEAIVLPMSPFARLMQGFQNQEVRSPNDPLWLSTETEAYREGGFGQATAFRVMTFAIILVAAVITFVWHIAGMFLLGAALMKAGLFAPERLHWHRRMALGGLLIGLPLAAAAVLIPRWWHGPGAMALLGLLVAVSGPLVAMGYLGGVTLLTASGRAAVVAGALGRVGRMALTNYLLETVIATYLMYHWGLGLFGSTTRPERMGIVVAIYAGLVVFSAVWMRYFRMGPAEWVWRTLTYMQPQPLARRP